MKVHSDIDGLSFAAMKTLMRLRAEQYELTVVEDSAQSLMIETEFGQFGVTDRTPQGLRLLINAGTPDNLHVIRDALVGQIADGVPDIAETITWSDTLEQDPYPPNLQFTHVVARARLCSDFQRVTLRLDRPEAFAGDDAIHLRILLPAPDNIAPDYPTLAPNGATKWPKGTKALHRPVYTARSLRGDLVEMDVFLHPGGRASDWAQNVDPGARLAIIGPGGGGVVDRGPVVLAGDETAYPAIARIMESLPHGTDGRAILLSHTGNRDYPFPETRGLAMEWTDKAGFVAATRAALAASPDCHAWIAAERGQTGKITGSEELKSVPKSQRYVAGYWTRFDFELPS
ncbi:MAG: siderophore-interacting protein [Pseudomonadota bacterium]